MKIITTLFYIDSKSEFIFKKESGREVRTKANERGGGGAVPHEEWTCYENLQSQAGAKGKERELLERDERQKQLKINTEVPSWNCVLNVYLASVFLNS